MKKCTHKNIHRGYGFLSEFRGLGIYEVCEDCGKVLDWIDDIECNTSQEIEHNKKIIGGRMKNLKTILYSLITGIVTGILLFLKFSSSDSDSELSQLENEGANLSGEIDALTDELDTLDDVPDLSDEDLVDYWKEEL